MTTLPLVEEIPPPRVTDALRALADLPGVLLLDSAQQRGPSSRFSFLTADPFAWFSEQTAHFGRDPFAAPAEQMRLFNAEPISDLPPFQGGAAGLIGYELARAFEKLPTAASDEFQLPDMAVGMYDTVVAWDHEHDRAWIISQGFPETQNGKRKHRAEQRCRFFRERLESAATDQLWHPTAPIETIATWPLPGHSGVLSNFSRDNYLRTVARVIEYIYAGDIFQANLSQRLLQPENESPLDLYCRLRVTNPAPFAGYFQHDDWAILSSSPERFIRVEANGNVETRPIKGTRQRHFAPEADLFTRDELQASDKDRAENVMIVDLLRNDLSRVCRAGSFQVPELCRSEAYETVQHLVSIVRAQLNEDCDIWDLLRATIPGGSITGAPKIRAMEIISELEPSSRGPYCGNLFYCGFDGEFDSSILIRTLIQRRGWVQCAVGGGIVAQSDPEEEYLETLHKAAGMLSALKGP